MSFNTVLSQLIAISRAWYSDFTLKSVPFKTASKAPYRYVYSSSNYALYSQNLQGRMGMRFALLFDTGVMCVFHCPVLVEDTRETPPTPTVVVLLGNIIQGKTYISINPALFTCTVLVLMTKRRGTALSATKQAPVVGDLNDDQGDAVTMLVLSWANTAYPDTPNINSFPLLHCIPPWYVAQDNHDVNKAFPVDTIDLQTWP